MAIITDAELEEYKKQEKKIGEYQNLYDSEVQVHTKNLKEQKKKTKKFTTVAIILGLMALIGISSTYYYMNDKITKQVVSLKDYKTKVQNFEEDLALLEETSLLDQEVYAVQVGAFEQKDLGLYSESFVNFREIRKEGFNKYALGNFESLEEAKIFRKELVDLGIKDAFIGFYQNGERQHIEEIEDEY